jgi:hypothetical protein
MWLHTLDIFFTLLHIAIIGFNLFGWIWKSTRKAHFYSILITAFSWFILGIWYGWGYCPVTDWQWRVKEKLGEHNLPNSFITYLADNLPGQNISVSIIDFVTAFSFAAVALLSVYMNFIKRENNSDKSF